MDIKQKLIDICDENIVLNRRVEEQQKEIEEHCETKGKLGKQVFALTKRVDELVEEMKLRKQYESFLQSVIRSGESLKENQTFEWFCEKRGI